MKYTSPIYVNEAVETTDILTSSMYRVDTVSKVVGKNENDIKEEAEGGLYGARAIVKSFGVPAFPNANYPTRSQSKHALNLELLLTNGSIIDLYFDVSEQIHSQPHGGVIVVKDIVIKPEDGTNGSGAFDVDVNDWGPYEDIVLPL